MRKSLPIVLGWSAFFGFCMGTAYSWVVEPIERIAEGPRHSGDADFSFQIPFCFASGLVWALIFIISLTPMWAALKPSWPPFMVLSRVSLVAFLVQVATFAGYDSLITRLDVFPRIYDHVNDYVITLLQFSVAIVPALLAAYIAMRKFRTART